MRVARVVHTAERTLTSIAKACREGVAVVQAKSVTLSYRALVSPGAG